MFRVGFGDFFLLSIPSRAGPQHILIDCGVHAGNIGSIQDAVAQLARDTESHLALLIMTHRHADHISGFATCRDVFAQFTVDRVWMSWFENPGNTKAMAFQASLTSMAQRIHQRLMMRTDEQSKQYRQMVGNILGPSLAAAGVSNQDALKVLHGGFKNTPPIDYYQAGDSPTLPDSLTAAGVSARILGPPIDESLISQMTNVNEQYLVAIGPESNRPPIPFASAFWSKASAYPQTAFEHYSEKKVRTMIAEVQPDVLSARAEHADRTLNNQSLVVLFTCNRRNLLFAGDAQWGNWENFLYGGAYGTPGHAALTEEARQILGKLDFYKVGHHGSANATPKGALAAMKDGCAGMCSTQERCYNNVPKGTLLDALKAKTRNKLARSDQVAAGSEAPESDAGRLPQGFTTPGKLYIDYLI